MKLAHEQNARVHAFSTESSACSLSSHKQKYHLGVWLICDVLYPIIEPVTLLVTNLQQKFTVQSWQLRSAKILGLICCTKRRTLHSNLFSTPQSTTIFLNKSYKQKQKRKKELHEEVVNTQKKLRSTQLQWRQNLSPQTLTLFFSSKRIFLPLYNPQKQKVSPVQQVS